MATITTLRPSATSSGVGWSASPSGTLHGVTSDNNDATAALWSGSGSALILATPLDSPPAGERRHLVRLRARGEDGSAWWAVRLASGSLIAGAAASFGASVETITGSWQAGAPADGSTILSAYVTGQSSGVRIAELYLDVDTRSAPTFTPQVVNGAGVSTVTVNDTVTPSIRTSALDLDDLPARRYRYWVTLGGAVVWDTGEVSGAPVSRQTTPLDNGSYVAHLQVWSTLGTNTAYASAEQTLAFDVTVGAIPSPSPPAVTPEIPFYRVQVCAPNVATFDDGVAYVEVQRVDCPYGGYLDLPGAAGSYASTSDASVAPAGTDLEVTVLAGRDDGWRPSTDETLAAKYLTTGDQRGWRLNLDADGEGDSAVSGRPMLVWSPDGTVAGTVTAFATERAPIDPYGRVNLRVFLDVDNGAGGWTAVFETADAEGNWLPLGEPVTGSPSTSVFETTADLTVGAYLGGSGPINRFVGRVYSVQVRQGRTGPILASPDFTNHPAGTESFSDNQANTWLVNSPAALVSSQQSTSLAMLGPLATDECAEWVDFTIPRSGVGRSCAHEPNSCCSYYRVRTVGRVDSALLVSDWSDAYDPGLPRDLVFMWPSTGASVPSGWDRVTALDGRYLKGVANGATQPGTTGGAETHSHTTSGHTHTMDHLHTAGANTGSATLAFNSNDGAAGTLAYPSGHTHTRPSTNSTVVGSGSASPGSSSQGNNPARLEVLWIEPDGNPIGVPVGALALMGDIAPAGWDTYAGATGRFLRGASPSQSGGSAVDSEVSGHTHDVSAHSHSGTAHSHTSPDTGSTSGTLSFFSGPNQTVWASSHSHPITVNSSATASLDSGSGGTSGAAGAIEPPYRDLRVRQNNSGASDLPVGIIAGWRGSLELVPDSWQLCDGTNGTPDMFGRYPRGATSGIGTSGGNLDAHNHTTPDHTHTTAGHAHSSTVSATSANKASITNTGSVSTVSGTHLHTMTDTNSTTPTVAVSTSGNLSSTTTEPPYAEVAFIQLMETPTPPPDPVTFCLEWSEDEHLIRTLGPAGPMYAPVIGMFEWSRDRPFTVATGVNGTRFVTSAPPGGRDLRMVAAVESEADLAALRAVLARPLVLISPSDSSEVWAAPVAETVRIVKVGRIRQVTADFISTGPEPGPQLADVGA